jgi:hypothetical protein
MEMAKTVRYSAILRPCVSFIGSLSPDIVPAPVNSVCGTADSWTGCCDELDGKRFFWYHPKY